MSRRLSIVLGVDSMTLLFFCINIQDSFNCMSYMDTFVPNVYIFPTKTTDLTNSHACTQAN